MFSSPQTSFPSSTTTRRAAGALVAGLAGLWMSAQSAQAADVYWSVGVHQPGVSVGVSNAPPVVVHTAPHVIYAPPPRVVYGPAPVVVYQQPVYRTQWAPPGHGKHWHKHHKHGHRHDWDDRHDRREDRHDRREDRRGDRWDDRHWR